MKRDSFIFYRSFYDALQKFSADVQLALYNAIAGYACYGTEPELEGPAEGVWILIKPQLDANICRYKNGCKGGGGKAHTRESASGDSCKKSSSQQKKTVPAKVKKQTPPAVAQVESYWNNQVEANACAMPKIRATCDNRRRSIAARLREYGTDAVLEMLGKAVRSEFLNGRNPRGWVATFDWLMQPRNFLKVLEGNYDNQNTKYHENYSYQSRQDLEKQQRDAEFAEYIARTLSEGGGCVQEYL